MSLWTTCKCGDCVTIAIRLRKTNNAGAYKRTSPEAAMQTLDQMIERRWSNLAVASATGIKPATASAILAKRRKGHLVQLGPRTCKALIEHGEPTDGSVGSVGSMRRLQGLAYMGHTLEQQSAETGIPITTLHAIREARTGKVRTTTHNVIRDASDRIGITPGPSEVARRIAGSRGWVSLFAWDDDTIDNPRAGPRGIPTARLVPVGIDEMAVQRRMHGDRTVRLHAGECAELVRRMRADGWSMNRIEAHTGVKADRYITREEVA